MYGFIETRLCHWRDMKYYGAVRLFPFVSICEHKMETLHCLKMTEKDRECQERLTLKAKSVKIYTLNALQGS